jgi:uncharacterized protein (DUF58 family)
MINLPLSMSKSSKVLTGLLISSLACLSFTRTIYILPIIYSVIFIYLWLWVYATKTSYGLQKLKYKWQAPDTFLIQHKYELTLTITNTETINIDDLYLSIRFSEGLSDSIQVQLAALSSTQIKIQYTPKVIGTFHIWGLELSGSDSHNLLSYHVHIPLALRMKVQQIPWTLKRSVPSSLRQITEQITRTQLSYQNEGDFQELRPYHSSDDRRTIAWKPSAKRNQLLVKTYQLPLRTQSYLALDISWVMRQSTFEYTRLNAATQISEYILNLNKAQGMGLILFDHQILAHLPSHVPLHHKHELLHYAHHIVHENSTEVTQAQLWSYLGDYLDWNGVKEIKHRYTQLSDSSYAHRILDQYQTRNILKHMRALTHPTIPLGLEEPFSTKEIEQELRYYCWAQQIPLPYRLIDGQTQQKVAIERLVQRLYRHQVSHLSLLTHSQRFTDSRDLQPLLQWIQQGGQLTWYQVGSHEYSYPQLLMPLRQQINIYPIPFVLPDVLQEQDPALQWIHTSS